MSDLRDRLGSRRALGALCFFWALLIPLFAPATISDQRRRLPPPARCPDPVEGHWRAHTFYPELGRWAIMTLIIKRKAGSINALDGEVLNEEWDGKSTESEPGHCRKSYHYIVRERAMGSFSKGRVSFSGTKWWVEKRFCGGGFGYNLDSVGGEIDPKTQEFISVVNDGGLMVNRPHVFRRVQCLSSAAGTTIKRPALFAGRRPAADSKGCACD